MALMHISHIDIYFVMSLTASLPALMALFAAPLAASFAESIAASAASPAFFAAPSSFVPLRTSPAASMPFFFALPAASARPFAESLAPLAAPLAASFTLLPSRPSRASLAALCALPAAPFAPAARSPTAFPAPVLSSLPAASFAAFDPASTAPLAAFLAPLAACVAADTRPPLESVTLSSASLAPSAASPAVLVAASATSSVLPAAPWVMLTTPLTVSWMLSQRLSCTTSPTRAPRRETLPLGATARAACVAPACTTAAAATMPTNKITPALRNRPARKDCCSSPGPFGSSSSSDLASVSLSDHMEARRGPPSASQAHG
mmetsp:Transcript_55723/g.144904  ORF Transcript_55723/g.144904 Transcript_55723/m.144904 type:complete len:319 (+) Transcript_55723:270-1226(+)